MGVVFPRMRLIKFVTEEVDELNYCWRWVGRTYAITCLDSEQHDKDLIMCGDSMNWSTNYLSLRVVGIW